MFILPLYAGGVSALVVYFFYKRKVHYEKHHNKCAFAAFDGSNRTRGKDRSRGYEPVRCNCSPFITIFFTEV